ncbi:protein Kti12p [Monosporozyma servazzii]
MPLILFTGYPSSGKTTYVNKLVQLLNAKIESDPHLANYKVILHSDKSLGIEHNDYVSSQDERKLRSKITSAVRRDLSRSNIVIVDSLNYIKGSRYQLHCEVKNISTSFICIHVMSSLKQAQEWNQAEDLTLDHTHWDDKLLNDLVARYEEPNETNRWDSPLFPILSPHDTFQDNNMIDSINNIIFSNGSKNSTRQNSPMSSSLNNLNNSINNQNKNILKPNSVTILKPAKQSNFMQLLEIETSKVNKILLQHLKEQDSIGNSNGAGQLTRIMIRGEDVDDPGCIFVDLNSISINLAKLQRLKRQFIQLNKLRDLDLDRIMILYSDYLNKNLSD